MDIMEVLNELTEGEFLELAYVIYCMGQEESKRNELESSIKRRLRIRIEEWLEI